MNKRILLHITSAVEKFAKEYGAIFDKAEGVWYVEGAIPAELEEFVIQAIRQRNYQTEIGPKCDICDSHTILKLNKKTGEQFWSCSRFPNCRGSKDWKYKAFSHATELLFEEYNSLPTTTISTQEKMLSISSDVQNEAKRITEIAVKLLNCQVPAKRWLEMKKITLGQKTPLEVMCDLEGCQNVEKLLLDTFQ